jgi:GTP pyrophosphokinase
MAKQLYESGELGDIFCIESRVHGSRGIPGDWRGKQEHGGGIVVHGVHDVAVRFSKCCNPVPGDEIVGFVTRGRGISIHRRDCVNVSSLPEEDRGRIIEATWSEDSGQSGSEGFMAEVNIYANDRSGLLNDITRLFAEADINILRLNTMTSKQRIATITIGFEIENRQQLTDIVGRLINVKDVQAVKRTNG